MTNEQLERIEYLRTKSEETELTPIEKREFAELSLEKSKDSVVRAEKSLEYAQKALRWSIVCGIVQIVSLLIVFVCNMMR